jgi:hypothetical protein
MKNRRDEGVRNINHLARSAFARHEIVELTDRSLRCMRPGSGSYGFDITLLGWGRIVVGGDLEDVVFQGGDGGGLLDRIAWLAGSDIDYLRGKTRRASGHDYWDFDADGLADSLKVDVAEILARYAPEPGDEAVAESKGDDEDDDEDDDEYADDDAGETAHLPKELAKHVEAMRELISDLRTGEMSEGEAMKALYTIDPDASASPGHVFSPSLLWAHEAAQTAFRLLDSQVSLASFLESPSLWGLKLYNAMVRAEKASSASRVAYARESMKRNQERLARAAR